jgi:cysteinyl-tRNA synthetase
MSVRLYNTLTRKKEELNTITEGKVGIYVCGITAYDSCHVGHARSAVVFDVITRYLRYRGYDVRYIKNFTDIDDKIINKANAEGTTIKEIAERYIAEHNDDMQALGVISPTVTPRATEYIDGMIKLINRLLDNGMAYVMGGDVYYAVEKFPGYGKLSCRNLEDMVAGARVDVNEKKKNPLDFALWKAGKEGEPWWESPWGKGRPGWHIECSIMSQRLLGETFDIHGGGEDLIFPHHENEIAQSEGATGKPLARYWMHNGFVRVNSEKMSKSLGNFYTIKDMLKQYHPDVLRYFMIQTHYRNPVDFSADSFAEARQGLERCYTTLKALKDVLAGRTDGRQFVSDQLPEKIRKLDTALDDLADKFKEAMDDDFNTARAIGHIFEMVRLVNSFMAEKGFSASDESLFVLDKARRVLLDLGQVFALFLVDPDDYLIQDRNREAEKNGIDIGEVERLIGERWNARAAKDWHKADEIRQKLAAMKIILKDSPTGTTWKIG